MIVSQIEEQILETLLWKVRVIALRQLKRFLGCDLDSVLRSLKRKGYIEQITLRTQLLDLASPLYSWNPAEQESSPDFWKISWQAESRFKRVPTFEEQVFLATDLACRHFGGVGGKLRQPFQLLHDLGTASMFVAKSSSNFERTNRWKSEDVIRRYFRHLKIRKIPDAAEFSNDAVSRVFEFAGRDYSGNYIKTFHEFWKRKNISYEIW